MRRKSKYFTQVKNKDEYFITIKEKPTLYQYRPINSYTVKALLNSEIWGTTPSAFNDPYDSSFCFREKTIKKAISQQLSSTQKKISKEAIGKLGIDPSTNDFDLVDYIYQRLIQNHYNNHKKTYCVSCFSEIYDSEIMWAHYASNASGFLLEYDGGELETLAKTHRQVCLNLISQNNPLGIDTSIFPEPHVQSLIPVIYSDKKPNYEQELISFIDITFEYFSKILDGVSPEEMTAWYLSASLNKHYEHSDTTANKIHTLLCCKGKSWEYEHEWRIWSYNSNIFTGQINDSHVRMGSVLPLSICLGEYISQYDEIAIREIAENKLGIPVYKMKTKMHKNFCKLEPFKLS